MSTRSSIRNLFPPLDNPELTIQRRSRDDPTLLNDFEMAAEGNGDPPVPDLRTMKELCQPSLNGRGGPIASIAIQATNFRLKNDKIQQVQNSCQFHGLLGDDANKHLDKFLHVTQSINVNGVTDDALHLYLFPHSLTHHATAWFDRLPRNLINTFEQMAKMFLGKYFQPSMVTKLINEITNFRQRPDESLFEAWERGTFMKRRPEKCYDLIKNMTAHRNDWDTSAQRSVSSSSITSSSDTKIAAVKAEMAKINKKLIRVLQVNQQVKAVTPNYETCGGPHSFNDCLATVGQTQNVYAARAYQGNTITNPKEEFKGITTHSGTAYQGPKIHTTSSSLPSIVEHEIKVTKDTLHPTNNGRTKDVQPLVVQTESPILNSEPVVAPIIEPVVAPAVLLNKLPEKLGYPSEFLIPCNFPRMVECLALADLGASINLMPLSVWNKLSLPDLSPTCMTLELADLPLILVRSFLKTGRALIDVVEGELTLRVGKEAITFNLDQTSRYSANYNDMTTNRID
nr:reverse transcriptase domain-containing protein [Tanacetum cinerariifolium]